MLEKIEISLRAPAAHSRLPSLHRPKPRPSAAGAGKPRDSSAPRRGPVRALHNLGLQGQHFFLRSTVLYGLHFSLGALQLRLRTCRLAAHHRASSSCNSSCPFRTRVAFFHKQVAGPSY